MHPAKMAPRRTEGRAQVGHVTGYRVAVKDLKGPDKHNVVLRLSI